MINNRRRPAPAVEISAIIGSVIAAMLIDSSQITYVIFIMIVSIMISIIVSSILYTYGIVNCNIKEQRSRNSKCIADSFLGGFIGSLVGLAVTLLGFKVSAAHWALRFIATLVIAIFAAFTASKVNQTIKAINK